MTDRPGHHPQLNRAKTAASDLEGGSSVETSVPDLRVPDEALVWSSACFARIKIHLPDGDQRFVRQLIDELDSGLQGRGMAAIDEDGLLRIVFGLTFDERKSTALLDEYVAAVISRLGVPSDAIVRAELEQAELAPAVVNRQTMRLRSLGLRALGH